MIQRFPKGDPIMMHVHRTGKPGRDRLVRYGMMACCVVMLIPVAAFFVAGGTVYGLWADAGIFAPLALCAGAHLVMHRMMGKSCHGATHSDTEEAGAPAPTSAAKRQTGNHVARTETLEG